jgi:hypothetical protein
MYHKSLHSQKTNNFGESWWKCYCGKRIYSHNTAEIVDWATITNKPTGRINICVLAKNNM